MIDTEALRKKVIDLAIQGKLTQQLPEDGNAEDLYAQIQKEKAKLIKEGKIKKEKALSPISDNEIPFEIPENWKWVRLGETSFIERGGSPRPIKSYITNSEDGINWIKIGDVEKGGKYIYKTNEKIIPEGEKKSRHVYPGDFLLTNSMSFGRPYISMVEGCIHDGWLLIRDLNGYSADYLYYLLSSAYMYGQFCNKASGATVDNLNIDKVNSALIPLPPKAEQIRIADTIADISSQIDIIDALQQQYESDRETLKEKIIDAGIRGKLTEQLQEDGNAEDLYAQILEEKAKLIKEGKIKKEKPLPEISGDEIPFEIPDNWKWVRLGSVLNEVIVPQRDKPKRFDGDIPWCRIEDADGNYMSKSHSGQNVSQEIIDEMNLRVFPTGTILSACSGGSIGRILITTTELCTNQTFNGLVCSTGLFNRYLFYFLKNSIGRLKKMGSGAAMEYVSQKKIGEMLIPLPPLNEQKRIAAQIRKILLIIDTTIGGSYENK